MPKTLKPCDPKILCRRVKLESVSETGIFMPANENKITPIAEVVESSKAGRDRGIENGDLVITAHAQYPEYPVCLTEKDEVPIEVQGVERLEIIDPAHVIGIYKEAEPKNATNS